VQLLSLAWALNEKRGQACYIAILFGVVRQNADRVARKPRIEIEGGLYHIITRGNSRQRIFGSHEDYSQMLRLLEAVLADSVGA
jgi:hypothetical protein